MASPFFDGAFFGGGFFQNLPSGGGTIISFQAGINLRREEVERIRLEREIKRKKRELKRVEKRVKAVESQISSDPPPGILANLHLLETREREIETQIASFYIDLQGIKDVLGQLTFEEDDDDDLLGMI